MRMEKPSDSALAYAGTLVDAQRAWSALRGHGVDAWLLDQNQGNLYQLGSVAVTVRAEDLEKARALLVQLDLLRVETPSE